MNLPSQTFEFKRSIALMSYRAGQVHRDEDGSRLGVSLPGFTFPNALFTFHLGILMHIHHRIQHRRLHRGIHRGYCIESLVVWRGF